MTLLRDGMTLGAVYGVAKHLMSESDKRNDARATGQQDQQQHAVQDPPKYERTARPAGSVGGHADYCNGSCRGRCLLVGGTHASFCNGHCNGRCKE